MRKYENPSIEALRELEEAGITKGDWKKLVIGSDLSLEGIMYSLGGMASWLNSKKTK